MALVFCRWAPRVKSNNSDLAQDCLILILLQINKGLAFHVLTLEQALPGWESLILFLYEHFGAKIRLGHGSSG